MSFLSAIAAMSLAIMLPVLLSLRKTGIAGTISLAAACGLAALAAAINMATNVAPGWVPVWIGTIAVVAAYLLVLRGFREFLGRQAARDGSIGAAVTGLSALLILGSHATGSPSAPVLVAASLSCLICLTIAVTIVRGWPRERAIAPYMLLCCAMAFAVAIFYAARLIALTTGFDLAGTNVEPHVAMKALQAAHLSLTPLFFLGIILMLHGRVIANLRHMIAHDDLTGVLSRRAFMTEFEKMLKAGAANGGQTAFMLLDLDRFKQINDAHGHAGGDAALKHFTSIVGATLAKRGIIGRLGGEEFGIALNGMGRLEAAGFAETLCNAVRDAPVGKEGNTPIALTVSIGLAMADPGNSLTHIMVQADVALYEAKALGRDRLSVAGSLHTNSTASARALAGAAAQMRAASVPTADLSRPLSSTG